MLTAVPLFYTGLMVCLNVIARGGGSNLFPPEQFSAFTQQEIDERIKGSKIVVVSEQVSSRLCLRAFRTWLTIVVYAERHLGSQGLHAFHVCPYDNWDKPYQVDQIRCCICDNWLGRGANCVLYGLPSVQWLLVRLHCVSIRSNTYLQRGMPPPDPQCTTFQRFAMIQAVFNLSSDVLIIAIPIPMIASLTLPLKQKIGLGVLFSMGSFVVSLDTIVGTYITLLITNVDHCCNIDEGVQSIGPL